MFKTYKEIEKQFFLDKIVFFKFLHEHYVIEFLTSKTSLLQIK